MHIHRVLRPFLGARRRTRRRTLTATLAAVLCSVSTLTLVAPSAEADFVGVAEINPDTGFPAYYTDEDGLSVQLCIDGSAYCSGVTREDLVGEGAAGEAFYSYAVAEVAGFKGEFALEAFGQGISRMVYARTRFRGDAIVAGGKYTFTGPFRTDTAIADDRRVRFVDDEGTGFYNVLQARGLGPFITWDTFGLPASQGGPPAGYIGNPSVLHRVKGSPTGFNKFRVQGPGIAGTCQDPDGTVIPQCAETDQFSVTGKVADGPSSTLDRDSIDFGNRADEGSETIRYTSIGTEPAVVSDVHVEGDAFSQTNDCGAVAPGGSCTITVRYTPAPGQTATGSLVISDNTEGAARTIPLSGRSLPLTSIPAGSLDLGAQRVTDGWSTPKPLTVRNQGVAPLHVTEAVTDNPLFAADASRCAAVPAGGSCAIDVSFDPDATGEVGAKLTVTSDDGQREIALRGTGTQSGIGGSSGVAFGSVGIGQARTGKVRITNDGTSPLRLVDVRRTGKYASYYSVGGPVSDSCVVGRPIPVGETCYVGVTFRPRSVGSRPATLSVLRDDGPAKTVVLTGTGKDVTRPTVRTRTPARGTRAASSGTNVTVTFSEGVTGVGRSTFVLTNLSSGRRVSAVVRRKAANRFVLDPRTSLPRKKSFRVTLVGGRSAIRDVHGVALRSTSWGFRTR